MGKENEGEINGHDAYSDEITTNDDNSSGEDSDDG